MKQLWMKLAIGALDESAKSYKFNSIRMGGRGALTGIKAY